MGPTNTRPLRSNPWDDPPSNTQLHQDRPCCQDTYDPANSQDLSPLPRRQIAWSLGRLSHLYIYIIQYYIDAIHKGIKKINVLLVVHCFSIVLAGSMNGRFANHTWHAGQFGLYDPKNKMSSIA
jgi:hypothetical protein